MTTNKNHIHQLVEICAQHGITRAILSPGSRCAPLTIAFNRHPEIECTTIVDERCAAFYALGIAQQTRKPVVIVCTSGTAALNYAPAIAEAYYQRVPLLILTADRPSEWIDQNDMQSIRQTALYGNYIKKSFSLPNDAQLTEEIWHSNRIVSEAINACSYPDYGPVHINVPLREPLYDLEEAQASKPQKIIELVQTNKKISPLVFDQLFEQWKTAKNKWIVVGMENPNIELEQDLIRLMEQDSSISVWCETISNLHHPQFFHNIDGLFSLFGGLYNAQLKPDLVVSLSGMLVSKKMKLYLRHHRPNQHWLIDKAAKHLDTYQSLTKVLPIEANTFFGQLAEKEWTNPNQSVNPLQTLNAKLQEREKDFYRLAPFSDLKAYQVIFEQLPTKSNLQLGNSMPVRYGNLLGLANRLITCYANRGVGGIDGASSTAAGAASTFKGITTLISGDLSFFYDSNALWNKKLSNNLRIIIVNNSGGNIFRIIDGPNKISELENRFEVQQTLNAQLMVESFGLEYHFCDEEKGLHTILSDFFEDSKRAKVLEIKTDGVVSTQVFKDYFQFLLEA